MRISTVIKLSMAVVTFTSVALLERMVSPLLREQARIQTGMQAAALMRPTLDALFYFSAERGPSNGVMGSELPLPADRLADLIRARNASDQAWQRTRNLLGEKTANETTATSLTRALDAAMLQMMLARRQVDTLTAKALDEREDNAVQSAVNAMIDSIPLFAPGLNALEHDLAEADPTLIHFVTLARLATEMRDYAGQLGSVFTAPIVAQRPLSNGEISKIDYLQGVVQTLNRQLRLAYDKTATPASLQAALTAIDANYFTVGLPFLKKIAATGRNSGNYDLTTAQLAQTYVPRMNVMLDLRDAALLEIQARLNDIDRHNRTALILALAAALLLSLLVMGVFILVNHRLTRPVLRVNEALRQLAMGDDQISLPVTRWHDEIGEVVTNLRHLTEVVRERKAATEAVRKAQQAAEAANQAKSLFLANMSHELRTPMNAILGFSEMISRNPETSEAIREKVAIINRSGEHLLSMINDVLDLSKIEAGKIVVEAEAIDLPALIEDISRMFEVRADAAGLRFNMEMAPEVARYVLVDGKKLRQVLINLLGNAVKFTREGGFALRVRTQPVPGDTTALRLHLEVKDSGPGIALDQQEDLFKPFVQLAATASSQKGTGLGLSISKSLVELMGGNIGVESAPRQGALFWIDLPVAVAEAAQTSTQHDMLDVIGLSPGQPIWRILVVEDNPENRLLLVGLLKAIGFEVREAENGAEAIALFEQWPPHFIWMDMRMPVLDGYQATRRIRGLPGGEAVKIIALTASVFREQRRYILDAGCNDIVYKPYRSREIFDSMAQQLGVQYVYRQVDRPQPLATPMPEAELNAAIAALARGVRQELIEAAECGDRERFEDALKPLEADNNALAATLKRLSFDYLFDKILAMLTDKR